MRIAIIVAALMLAAPVSVAPVAAAQEATTKSVTGDFDADGIEDRVDLVVGEGRYKLTVTRGRMPAEPIIIGYGPEENAGDVLEVRNGGRFITPSTKTRRNPPPTTYRNDVFIYGQSNGQKFIWSWAMHSFASMAYLGDG